MNKVIIYRTQTGAILVNGREQEHLNYQDPSWMAMAAVTDVLDAIGCPYEAMETVITIPDGWFCFWDGWVRWNPEKNDVDRFGSFDESWQKILELQKD